MHITMVKKRLANGEPCEKCAQTEEMLKRRGYWERIDDVVWALEGDPDSPGNLIGARHGIKVAPFFVLRGDDGAETALTSPLKLIRDHFADPVPVEPSRAKAARPEAADWRTAAKALSHAEPSEILRFALETWSERCPIAFGGAEEIVLIDMATRLGLPFRVVTVDTGRLHAETYAYLDDVRRRYGVSIEAYLPDTTALTAFLREKGLNSFYREGHRECCGIRKIAPLGRALAGCEAWVTGRRRDQGPPARADLDDLRDGSTPFGSGRSTRQGQPPRRVDARRALGLHPAPRRSLQPAPRAGLHVHRMRAVHAADPARPAPARGALVVGVRGRSRVRRPHRRRRDLAIRPTRAAHPSARIRPRMRPSTLRGRFRHARLRRSSTRPGG